MNVRVLPVKMVELAPMAYTALHVIARRNTQVLHALKVSSFFEGIHSYFPEDAIFSINVVLFARLHLIFE